MEEPTEKAKGSSIVLFDVFSVHLSPNVCNCSIEDLEPFESKNRLSFDQWPAGYFFPTYCGGPCKLVSSNALLKISNVINHSLVEKFPLEDVLFSGIFRTIANVTNIQHKRGLCEHADRAYEDPAKHLFSGLLNIYFSKDFEQSSCSASLAPSPWSNFERIFEMTVRQAGLLKLCQISYL